MALGRTVITGVPRTTWLRTWKDPATTDWVVTRVPPSVVTSTASVTRPLSSRTATRAATSLPSGPEVMRMAAGCDRCTTATTASALGRDRNCSISGADTAYTVVAPYSPRVATTSSVASPHTSAAGSPSRRAMVSSSRVALRTPLGVSSARTRISDTVDSYRWAGVGADGVAAGDRRWARSGAPVTGHRGRRGSRRAGPRRCRRRRRRCPAVRAGAGATSSDPGGGRREPDRGRVDPDVGEREGLDRLLLGQHDRPEGRVAGLVGLVGDRHDGGQLGAHLLGRGVALPGDGDGAAVDGQRAGEGGLVDVEALGDHRRDDRHLGVGRRHPGEHEVEADVLEGLGEDERGGEGVRAVDGVVQRRARPLSPPIASALSSPSLAGWGPTVR